MSYLVPLSALSQYDAVIDARTPSEFSYDHLPGALSLPVLSDDERHKVGALYAESAFHGKQRGATLIAHNIADHIENTLSHYPQNWKPLIYCWRGGKRSGAFTHILRQIGWQAGQLQGGYKAFRRTIIDTLESVPARLNFVVVGGPTGCRKTAILQDLAERGEQVLDLEAMAEHKGSLLGGRINQRQPSQPAFENRIAQALQRFNPERVVFVESESRRIGLCHLPTALITAIRAGVCTLIEAPISVRVAAILDEYSDLTRLPDFLVEQLHQLAQFHGNSQIQIWLKMIQEQQWEALAESLMVVHYDPSYQKSLAKNYHASTAKRYELDTLEKVTIIAQQLQNDFQQ